MNRFERRDRRRARRGSGKLVLKVNPERQWMEVRRDGKPALVVSGDQVEFPTGTVIEMGMLRDPERVVSIRGVRVSPSWWRPSGADGEEEGTGK